MSVITVVVPIYNAENYLDNCIKSIINQTHREIEILLVNDGSSDGSYSICESYKKKDMRVKVFHKENEGVSKTRNFGISKAIGEYICFVDADDILELQMIEKLLLNIKESKSDLAICGHNTVYLDNGNRNIIVTHKNPEFKGTTREFLEKIEYFLNSESIQGPCGKLYKISIIKSNLVYFPVDLSFGEDTFFVYKYLENCSHIVSISESYYLYMKRNSSSLSSIYREDKIEIFLYLYKQLDILMNKFKVNDKKDMIDKRICIATLSCIGEIYNPDVEFSNKSRIGILEKILLKNIVLNSFKSQSKVNGQIKLLNFLAQKNYIYLIDKFFLIKEYLKIKKVEFLRKRRKL